MAGRRSALFDAAQHLGGADDGNTLIRLEIEQIPVARDDQIGLRGQGTGEYLVVLRIVGYLA